VPDNRLGVRADEIGRHGRPVRSDHDQIGVPLVSFGQDLDINTAEPDGMGNVVFWESKAGTDLLKRLKGALFLRFVEFWRNILHETRW